MWEESINMDYSQKKKQKSITCSVCKEIKPGFTIHWKTSWFRGDDEVEDICLECLSIREKKEAEEREAYEKKMRPIWKKRAEKEASFWNEMKKKLESKYKVEYLTQYHWRINNEIDIFPTNRRFHNFKTQQRGDYKDMHGFLAKHFAS